MLRTCFGYTVSRQYILKRNRARFDRKFIVGALLSSIMAASAPAQQAVIAPLTAAGTPMISPPAGLYREAQMVTISDSTTDATIY